jgi:hypothetical protein
MKQKALPIKEFIFFSWSIAGFLLLLQAAAWIRDLNPQSPWLSVSLALAISTLVPAVTFGLALFALLLNPRRRSSRIYLNPILQKINLLVLFLPLPVIAYWICLAWLSASAGYGLLTNSEDIFHKNVDRLAALEETIVGPVGAGEVYYQFGHKSFERQDLKAAEWCWSKSLAKWLSSRLKNDYGPVFELDDLGELYLFEGRSAEAKRYFEQAVSITDGWQELELSQKAPDEALLYRQSRMRAQLGLARVYESENKLDLAAALYEKVLSSPQANKDAEAGTIAGVTATLSNLYLSAGKTELAKKLKSEALDYQRKSVGLVQGSSHTTYSEKAQSQLAGFARELRKLGQSSEADDLDHQLESIQKARRNEINLSRPEQDKMVDFIIGTTRKILDIKYDTNKAAGNSESELAGIFSQAARNELNQAQKSTGWQPAGQLQSKPNVAVRVDQLSLSNKSTSNAIPVEVTGTIFLKSDPKSSEPDTDHFRYKFLIQPNGNGQPLVTSFEDLSETLKRQ